MDAEQALKRLSAAGIAIAVRGNDLDVTYQTEPTAQQWDWLKANKPVLLRLLSAPPSPPADLTDDDREAIRETFEERAAIHEFDGGLSRPEAERQAREAIRIYHYRLTDKPASWLTMIAPGCDLDQARYALTNTFGPNRLVDVVEYQPRREAA